MSVTSEGQQDRPVYYLGLVWVCFRTAHMSPQQVHFISKLACIEADAGQCKLQMMTCSQYTPTLDRNCAKSLLKFDSN